MELLVAALAIFFQAVAAKYDPDVVCSVKNPNSSQICISVKFPWKLTPVLFCTDKSKVEYTPRCTGRMSAHHCYDDGRMDTLKITTPWDCCPIISAPAKNDPNVVDQERKWKKHLPRTERDVSGTSSSSCENVQCAPEPFNRTCKPVKAPGDCCPTYICDDVDMSNCASKRLEPDCLTPPPDKVNCTVFRDPYGCCNVYQCRKDEKAGVCPKEAPAPISEKEDNRSTFNKLFDGFVSHAKKALHKISVGVKSTLENHFGSFGKAISSIIPIFPLEPHIEIIPRIRCTGDYTCPGSMKCCHPLPFHFKVTHIHHVKREGKTLTKMQVFRGRVRRSDVTPIDGLCVEPEEGTMYPEYTEGPNADTGSVTTVNPDQETESSPSDEQQTTEAEEDTTSASKEDVAEAGTVRSAAGTTEGVATEASATNPVVPGESGTAVPASDTNEPVGSGTDDSGTPTGDGTSAGSPESSTMPPAVTSTVAFVTSYTTGNTSRYQTDARTVNQATSTTPAPAEPEQATPPASASAEPEQTTPAAPVPAESKTTPPVPAPVEPEQTTPSAPVPAEPEQTTPPSILSSTLTPPEEQNPIITTFGPTTVKSLHYSTTEDYEHQDTIVEA